MARYKHIDTNPRFLPIDLSRQLLPGPFEHAFHHHRRFRQHTGQGHQPYLSQVLFIYDRQGLIGREMFAFDGVKLPSNASKSKSGTRADFERQIEKLEAMAQAMPTCLLKKAGAVQIKTQL